MLAVDGTNTPPSFKPPSLKRDRSEPKSNEQTRRGPQVNTPHRISHLITYNQYFNLPTLVALSETCHLFYREIGVHRIYLNALKISGLTPSPEMAGLTPAAKLFRFRADGNPAAFHGLAQALFYEPEISENRLSIICRLLKQVPQAPTNTATDISRISCQIIQAKSIIHLSNDPDALPAQFEVLSSIARNALATPEQRAEALCLQTFMQVNNMVEHADIDPEIIIKQFDDTIPEPSETVLRMRDYNIAVLAAHGYPNEPPNVLQQIFQTVINAQNLPFEMGANTLYYLCQLQYRKLTHTCDQSTFEIARFLFHTSSHAYPIYQLEAKYVQASMRCQERVGDECLTYEEAYHLLSDCYNALSPLTEVHWNAALLMAKLRVDKKISPSLFTDQDTSKLLSKLYKSSSHAAMKDQHQAIFLQVQLRLQGRIDEQTLSYTKAFRLYKKVYTETKHPQPEHWLAAFAIAKLRVMEAVSEECVDDEITGKILRNVSLNSGMGLIREQATLYYALMYILERIEIDSLPTRSLVSDRTDRQSLFEECFDGLQMLSENPHLSELEQIQARYGMALLRCRGNVDDTRLTHETAYEYLNVWLTYEQEIKKQMHGEAHYAIALLRCQNHLSDAVLTYDTAHDHLQKAHAYFNEKSLMQIACNYWRTQLVIKGLVNFSKMSADEGREAFERIVADPDSYDPSWVTEAQKRLSYLAIT